MKLDLETPKKTMMKLDLETPKNTMMKLDQDIVSCECIKIIFEIQ